jgi:hypothetical protein
MTSLLIGIAAAGAGWLFGTRTTRRIINEEVDRRVAELEQRLRQVSPAAAPPRTAPAPAPAPAPVEEISSETIAALSAAICAYLGKPARIRRVRRVQSGINPWAQQGRVYVMGSHALPR